MAEKSPGLWYSEDLGFPLANGSLESGGKGAQEMLSKMSVSSGQQMRIQMGAEGSKCKIANVRLKSGDLSSEFCTSIFNCFLDISTRMPNRCVWFAEC